MNRYEFFGGITLKKIKKIILAVLCLALLTQNFVTLNAQTSVTVSSECDISDINVPISSSVNDAAIGSQLEINAKSAVLMEVNTGKVLYEMNANEVLPPASITKIMSLLLVMEAIDSKTLSTEDVITASEHACSMGGSQIWLEPNETMTVDDLLKATVIASANDATVALGEKIAGSEEGFVAMMNEKANQLGMTLTHFDNCTGLDSETHKTCAYDVAVMSCELIKHKLIQNYSTVWMDTLRDGKSELVNTNKLVRFYDGTTGLKTGTTSAAGYCLSATAQRDGLELAAVIMGGNSSNDRFAGAKKLLDYGFANFGFANVEAELKKDTFVKVNKGTEKKVRVEADKPYGALLKKGDISKIEQRIELPKEVKAPVKKGDRIGTVNLYCNDEQIGAIDLKACETVEKMSFFKALLWLIGGIAVA